MHSAPLLDLQRVSVMRGSRVVLRDLSLRIGVGEHVAILGPNGCGKSTLIKTLTREIYPLAREGSKLTLLGRETWEVSQLRVALGIVEMDLRCSRPVTAYDLALSGFLGSVGLWPHQTATEEMHEKTAALMERLGVTHLAKRDFRHLSSGEARRVTIARALVHGPLALLFDEPSTSLDLGAQNELRSAMRTLAQSGVGLLLVTHQLSDIIPEIKRVILMKDGQVLADGAKQELLTASRLEELFGVRVELIERDGFYHCW